MGSLPPAHSDDDLMKMAIDEGCRGVHLGEGGPFGAVITQHGQVIARGHNRVLQTNDPTAHAEVVAIRDACAKLGRFSLHDCVLYSSCEPCPMCFSAIHWAKIPTCFYSATADDAAKVGFDDRFLYDAIRGKPVEEKCRVLLLDHPHTHLPFQQYKRALEQNKSSLY
ncbi:Guanine deaminase [Gracilariopsis chorda]|uniref:Guanine deaminase n=1 Tax=Gracilariopsis chorda TaxID=448386 RepID=A0A2V3IC35_9FLOR|nr:Guanine deaminase [Gracilariopsis chorda]PXF39667.1 Guanine deaminase [Gracilariopsis chorda]|eukprot:PXF39460.1 Guanine deaminase [Gracilariopsis chorda]